MKVGFFIIVMLHGLIHLLGFVKGFELRKIKELMLPISKSMGLVWLVAAILFLIYGVLNLTNSKFDWILGFVAVVISQVLILCFWSDAKLGTIPNILILVGTIVSLGYYNFQKLVQQETNYIISQNKTVENKVVNESDIQTLPGPVKNWLRNSGAVGKPFISIGKITQQAEIKMKPEQKKWMPATAIQYTTIDKPAFIWSMDVKMNSWINFQGRDKFQNGHGEMLIKLNSVINIVKEEGEKLDEGTLQRFLGEMVWFPSLALSPHITWEQIDATTAKASMIYKGVTGSGIFSFNANGEVTKFTALRYKGNEADSKRYDWTINISDYKTFEGIKVPVKITSTWALEKGDWTWMKLEVTDIRYNENVNCL